MWARLVNGVASVLSTTERPEAQVTHRLGAPNALRLRFPSDSDSYFIIESGNASLTCFRTSNTIAITVLLRESIGSDYQA